MSVDTIGNFLTAVRNACMASKQFVEVPYSIVREKIALILKEEGFVRDVMVIEGSPAEKKIKIVLKYSRGESVIHRIDRISTPGYRMYTPADRIRPVIGGLGVSVLSTNQGILSHREAKKRGIGGEIVCTVW